MIAYLDTALASATSRAYKRIQLGKLVGFFPPIFFFGGGLGDFSWPRTFCRVGRESKPGASEPKRVSSPSRRVAVGGGVTLGVDCRGPPLAAGPVKCGGSCPDSAGRRKSPLEITGQPTARLNVYCLSMLSKRVLGGPMVLFAAAWPVLEKSCFVWGIRPCHGLSDATLIDLRE